MPLIRVELFDYRISEETSAKLIEKLTDALCEATTRACATTRG
jgi:phenylpyruvate tautomerase PptA (4-oxalocrotonate tautomerase family)